MDMADYLRLVDCDPEVATAADAAVAAAGGNRRGTLYAAKL
jgi:hypothetical protein